MSILYRDDKRFVYSCEVKIESKSDNTFQFPISEIITYLKQKYRTIVYKRSNQELIYRILKVSLIQDRYLVLFMQHVNKNASDPAFADLMTGKSRLVKKQPTEGGACSAHLVIDTQVANPLFPNQYKACLEEMQGLSKGAVEDLLNFAIRPIAYQDPNSENVKHSPRIALTFFASNTFEDQFKQGKIHSITAFRNESIQSEELDSDEYRIDYRETHRLEFKPVGLGMIDTAFNKIAMIAQFAQSKGYDRLKVTHESDHKQQSSDYDLQDIEDLSIEQTAQDIRLSPFAMKTPIQLARPIHLCDYKWHSELIKQMIKTL